MPIGALALGIVIGLSILVPTLIDAIKTFVRGVAAIVGNVSPDWNAVKDVVVDAFRAVDYSDFGQAGRLIFSKKFFSGLLTSCLHAALDTDALASEFKTLLDAALASIARGALAFVIFTVLGALVGYYATRAEMRRNVAKRKFGRAILVKIVGAILNVTIVACGVFLILKAQKFAVLCALALFLLYGTVSFFEAYLLHGYKKVSLKKVLRLRNFVSLAVVSLVQILLSVLIAGLAFLITGFFVGAFIGYAVLVLTLTCLTLNVEAYVKALAGGEGEGAFDKERFVKAMNDLSPALCAETGESGSLSAATAEDPSLDVLPADPSVSVETSPEEESSSTEIAENSDGEASDVGAAAGDLPVEEKP